jgi:hypothetical protein
MTDISEFDKDQLAEFALSEYKVELDMRKSLDKLKAEVEKLAAKPAVKAEIAVKDLGGATHIKNIETGNVFPVTPLLIKHLGSNGLLCNDKGNRV